MKDGPEIDGPGKVYNSRMIIHRAWAGCGKIRGWKYCREERGDAAAS